MGSTVGDDRGVSNEPDISTVLTSLVNSRSSFSATSDKRTKSKREYHGSDISCLKRRGGSLPKRLCKINFLDSCNGTTDLPGF